MRMLNASFKLTGRCHPWCGDVEYRVGRAAEKRAALREAWNFIADQKAAFKDCPVAGFDCDPNCHGEGC